MRLETLPSDAQDITCTGDLQCNSSDAFCIFGDLEKAEFPVLVPTDIRAKTVKRCDPTGCRLRVQVTMDMSVMFISDLSDEIGSDSSLCANLFILREVPSSHLCSFVRVSLPPSSIPRRTGASNSIKVGTIVYNSINARPGNEWYITSYTHPRYNEELNVHHKLPGCTELDPKEKILECEAPSLEVFYNSSNVSVRVVNGTSARNTTLRVFYKARHKRNDRTHFLVSIGVKYGII
ncbi:hypothetical protein GDO78_009428 [Eleutherodactylus coqui]|uniref:Interleukin-17 receptor C/E N-terminal domain-containing protein n=1 Tax=Eleutherodactylus coqui TaxID=57060 RepID=A0A8J6F7V7_ELECQ|nr:hypothetical protein GDO78_009428 [Eleutherodactylus coqui]